MGNQFFSEELSPFLIFMKQWLTVRMKIKQILIICLILTNQVLFSQKIISHFRLYSSADGLPSNQLSCLTQDSYGYLWVGTLQGISRFNGTTFQNFNNEQSNFPAKCCTHLLQVNDSILFIGTSSGIVVYNLKINRFTNPRNQQERMLPQIAQIFPDLIFLSALIHEIRKRKFYTMRKGFY